MDQFLIKYDLPKVNQTVVKYAKTQKEAESFIKYAKFVEAINIEIYWVDFSKNYLEKMEF